MSVKKLIGHQRLDVWVPCLRGDPIPHRYRPLSPQEELLLRGQTNQWLQKRVVEETLPTHYVNNVVFAEKSNGGVRVCIDCSPANDVMEDFDWPLPRLQDIRHRVAGATHFSRIDLQDAFFRISIPIKWRYLTTYRVGQKFYRFRRMPFGLKTAPATFQRYMDHLLGDHAAEALWYIDDILGYAGGLRELHRRVRNIRRTLVDDGNIINESKSEYDAQGLLYAGLWIYDGGIGPNFGKVRQLLALPVPTTKAAIKSALGLTSYLRDFIPLTSHFTARLYESGKEEDKLSSQEFVIAWRRLLHHIATAATQTAHWSEGDPADLYADASQFAAGALLIQNGRIVAVWSAKLKGGQSRYSATDREHIALAQAASRFRVFTHGTSEVTCWSDHGALLTRKTKDMTPRQFRWTNTINQWLPNLSHVPGSRNPADFVSRWPVEITGGLISSI
jgi:hypothetical protein